MKRRTACSSLVMATALLALSCSDTDSARPTLPREELMDPETCMDCHPKHYREWSSSMHAYAAQDPVFLAMNERGQRETDGELGDFCIDCHAPLAVRLGLTEDGTNLDDVPDHLEGITCYFCHNVVDVTGEHNNPLKLADDTTMRGGISDPKENNAHGVAYSTLHDGDDPNSAKLCGACHDIVTPSGVQLERTYAEWQESVYNSGLPGTLDTCINCHMDGDRGIAADDPDTAVPSRTVHDHLWQGVDVALTDFPNREAMKKAVACALSSALRAEMTVRQNSVELVLETFAGHRFPSGAGQDRRAWVELIAYDEDGEIYFQTGVIAVDEPVVKEADDPGFDPNLWVMRDKIYDKDGKETHMFWNAAPSDEFEDGYTSTMLPIPRDFMNRHTDTRTFNLPATKLPARVTAEFYIRPMGREVLEDLVDSGDLDAAIIDEMPTFNLAGSGLEWVLEDDGYGMVKRDKPNPLECPEDYKCLLDPGGPGCN